MMKTKKNFSDTYITKMGWMVEITDNNCESDLLAIIYGFSQDGEGQFTGGLSYLKKWLGCSRSTVIRHLSSLVEKKIIIKHSETVNNVTFNRYRVNLEQIEKLRTPGIKMTPPRYQNDTPPGIKMTPNNTNIDNTKKEAVVKISLTTETESNTETVNRLVDYIKEDEILANQMKDSRNTYKLTEREGLEVLREYVRNEKRNENYLYLNNLAKYRNKIAGSFESYCKNYRKKNPVQPSGGYTPVEVYY